MLLGKLILTEAEEIQILRQRLGLTQAQAAQMLGMHKLTLGNIEAGRGTAVYAELALRKLKEAYVDSNRDENSGAGGVCDPRGPGDVQDDDGIEVAGTGGGAVRDAQGSGIPGE